MQVYKPCKHGIFYSNKISSRIVYTLFKKRKRKEEKFKVKNVEMGQNGRGTLNIESST